MRKESKPSIKFQQDYQVYIWGSGQDGRLGLNDTKPRKIPTKIETLKVV
jgi:alpha-tubulin suppressor-like RCC1 family protein